MRNASDEQTWWSGLLSGSADSALQIPDRLWESIVATALDFDTPQPAEDLLPADQPAITFNEPDPGFDIHHDGHPLSHGDALADDSFGADAEPAGDAYHDGDHQGFYDDAAGDAAIDEL